MQKVIILADGNYPSHPLPLAQLHSGLPVICCDGAANRFVAEGGIPTAIIGDGDSLSEEVREKCAHLIHQVAEQETNDLTKSVAYVKSKGAREICILGATGLRECHTGQYQSAHAIPPPGAHRTHAHRPLRNTPLLGNRAVPHLRRTANLHHQHQRPQLLLRRSPLPHLRLPRVVARYTQRSLR